MFKMKQQPDNVYAVILAGGSGTRFWPKSRHTSPKQLCAIGDADQSMLELTLSRLEGFIPPERRIIVTHKDQATQTKKIVGMRCARVIAEPEAKNTAAALALAALEIKAISKDSSPLMVSLHADSVIADVNEFLRSIETALDVCKKGFLTLMGIIPAYPETGYGYIEIGQSLGSFVHAKKESEPNAWKVKSFREKPELELAKEFVASGKFHWNSGLFVWSIDVILDAFQEHLPQTINILQQALDEQQSTFSDMGPEALSPYYKRLDKIAIDNAILEKSSNVAVVGGDFGWQDVGSWAALDQCFKTDEKGNLSYGDVLSIDTVSTTVDTDGAFVATIGLKDMVVVSAKGAVLVCPKDRAQDVKKIVEYLKSNNRNDLT
jgi:mannose-1-phosphate guanylyltransferase